VPPVVAIQIALCIDIISHWWQDGRVMMLEPAGEEDEADLLHHDNDDDDDVANRSGMPT